MAVELGARLGDARHGRRIWNPAGTQDLLKVVGATGFEPATPCAQGKPRRDSEVLISKRFAAFARRCDQICDHPSGDAS